MPQPPYAIISTTSHRRPRYGLLVLVALVLAGAGIATAWLLRPAGALPKQTVAETGSVAPMSQPGKAPAQAPATTPSKVTTPTQMQAPGQTPTQMQTPGHRQTQMQAQMQAPTQPRQQTSEPSPTPEAGAAALARSAAATPLLTRPASVCITCGTVEAVAGQQAVAGGKPGTAYRVQVRMDDGTLRSFTSATAPPPGVSVRVAGDGFRVVGTGG